MKSRQVQESKSELDIEGVPVCAANMCSPVVDQASFIDEISYKIGNKKYVENAPHF